jgi:hypothetical protein
LLGAFVPPHRVNGLITLDPYLLDSRRWLAGLVHVVHSP